MSKLSFKVSARAARLIGRENVANAYAAITELVKNSYDADARACLIFFLPRHKKAPITLSAQEFDEVSNISNSINDYYSYDGDVYNLHSDLGDEQIGSLQIIISQIVDLWIIDNGTGMSAKTIEDKWMVIGTDSKELDMRSAGGRVVTGAKGIGRFALDRLGVECELFSKTKDSNKLANWIVDWGDFEGQSKVIDEVTAVLDETTDNLSDIYKKHQLHNILPRTVSQLSDETPELIDYSKGTAIKISILNDLWDSRASKKLRETLEALLPPKDQADFGIFIYDSRDNNNQGWIDSTAPDQFDYRLITSVKEDGSIRISITRQEIDVDRISDTFFELPETQKDRYWRSDFEKGKIEYNTSLAKILKTDDQDVIESYKAIGAFDFTFYFFKRTNPNKNNLLKFPQRQFNARKRIQWLNSSGGIRLYRDNFRVRPYGEPGTSAEDWLQLSQRAISNPAAVTRIGWRVPSNQVAGTIHISKENNALLEDRSNREGIMNERVFTSFRDLIRKLIQEFEYDRSYIYGAFDEAYKIDNEEEEILSRGKEAAAEIIKKDEKKQKEQSRDNSNTSSNNSSENNGDKDEEELLLAKALTASEKKNEEQEEELRVLRGMATLGTVLISFTHELKQIKANMGQRSERITNAINRVIDIEKLQAVEKQDKRLSPFNVLDRVKSEDAKVSRWVDFALSSISPEKRRRKVIAVNDYLEGLEQYWLPFLKDKKIALTVEPYSNEVLEILAHEIELDSVFYNLIVNSAEAMISPKNKEERKISISCDNGADGYLTIQYSDNGPGLSTTLDYPEDIFGFGVSTKSKSDENDLAGTGIGMWLVKTVVDDFNGQTQINSKLGKRGFVITISLPKYIAPQNR